MNKVITYSLAKTLPRRFYKEVSISEGTPFYVLLDGRQIKTPKKRTLALPTHALAEAIADEWYAQADTIDPTRMPLTRFVNTAIDGVTETLNNFTNEIAAYARSDLICYRAEMPAELGALQAENWDPIVAWANEALCAEFRVVFSIIHVAQPSATILAFLQALRSHDAVSLTALHAITTLTGSALIALALARDWLSADSAWKAAHVDEDYQVSVWGEDSEALARRLGRRAEFDVEVRLLTLAGEGRLSYPPPQRHEAAC